jgi:hypothetical protein
MPRTAGKPDTLRSYSCLSVLGSRYFLPRCTDVSLYLLEAAQSIVLVYSFRT